MYFIIKYTFLTIKYYFLTLHLAYYIYSINNVKFKVMFIYFHSYIEVFLFYVVKCNVSA